MEIEEKEQDQEWCDSQAILIKNKWPGLHAANCRPKALESDMRGVKAYARVWPLRKVYEKIRLQTWMSIV
jgi:hypothetical protein